MAAMSVEQSIRFGFGRTDNVLFRPFAMGKWMSLAVAGMLMLAGEGGSGSFNFRNRSSGGGRRGGGGVGFPDLEEALAWLQANLVLVIAIVAAVVVVGFAIYLVMRWINSRGHFMMYEHVVKDMAAVGQAWKDMRRLGNSFFKFRIVYDLLIFNLFLVVVLVAGLLAWPDIQAALATGSYPFSGWTITAIVAGGLMLLAAGLLTLAGSGFVFGIVMPVMYVRDMAAWPAVKAAWHEIVMPNPGASAIYLLFRVVIAVGQSIWQVAAIFVFVVATCCVGFCAMMIPVVGMYPVALLSLPVTVFERAFALHFVSQAGPAYDVGWTYPSVHGFPVIMAPPGDPGSALAGGGPPPGQTSWPGSST